MNQEAKVVPNQTTVTEMGQAWIIPVWIIVGADQKPLIDQHFASKGQAKRVAVQLGFTLH